MIKVINVVGARPNFMKMAPIIAAMNERASEVTQVLVHTGQHYDDAMSGSFFRELGMPLPDINLEVGSGTHAYQTAQVMLAFDDVLERERPDWVNVVGDVNSTLACALVAAKRGIAVAHVEAGLRSFDRTMPEELNRLVTDQLSDLLLTPSPDADENLEREGIDSSKIVRVGNVMIDTLHRQLRLSRESNVIEDLSLIANEYAVLTLHRPATVDDVKVLEGVFEALNEISQRLPVIFPAHPRTQLRIKEFNIAVPSGVRISNPLGYRDFLRLWSNARLVLTDSGGLQEETTALGIPCMTLRENTERPITIEQGTNRLAGLNKGKIKMIANEILSVDHNQQHRIPDLWDGNTASRIVDALISFKLQVSSFKTCT